MKWTQLILGTLILSGRAAATVFEAEEAYPAGFREKGSVLDIDI